MNRLEAITYRFAVVAAVCCTLIFIVAAIANVFARDSRSAVLSVLFAGIGPVSIMAVYYAIRWAFTGRLQPWTPK